FTAASVVKRHQVDFFISEIHYRVSLSLCFFPFAGESGLSGRFSCSFSDGREQAVSFIFSRNSGSSLKPILSTKNAQACPSSFSAITSLTERLCSLKSGGR